MDSGKFTTQELGLIKICGRYYFKDGDFSHKSSCAFEVYMSRANPRTIEHDAEYKVPEEHAMRMRALHRQGKSCKHIAKMFCVSPSMVSNVVL